MNPAAERAAREPRIVAIGGGTGLSTMLKGLKKKTTQLTAIVTVTDNGGGSGVLRQELGMLPPGDVRHCIQALANAEPTMDALLAYRFTEGRLSGQSLGNLFLAALNRIYGSFDQAVAKMSEVLAITGRVLPVTNESIDLTALFDDGNSVAGETQITEYKKNTDSRITHVHLSPEQPSALPACLDALREADILLFGPGSLYTSIIPNLLVSGIPEAAAASHALKICIMNLMTQDGETEGYSGADHVRALFDHGGEGLFLYCLANNRPLPLPLLRRYREGGSAPIENEETELAALGVQTVFAPIAGWQEGMIRHDPDDLAGAVLDLYRRVSPTKIYR